jgi:hypothetical protein
MLLSCRWLLLSGWRGWLLKPKRRPTKQASKCGQVCLVSKLHARPHFIFHQSAVSDVVGVISYQIAYDAGHAYQVNSVLTASVKRP